MRSKLLRVWKATGDKPKELEQPPIPEEMTHIVGWLGQIPPPITWQEVVAWQQVTGERPQRWELDVLMKLDRKRQS